MEIDHSLIREIITILDGYLNEFNFASSVMPPLYKINKEKIIETHLEYMFENDLIECVRAAHGLQVKKVTDKGKTLIR